MGSLKGHYNIALIPAEKKIVQNLEQYSQDLAKKNPSPYILGVNSLPHVSVAIFETACIELNTAWRNIKNIIDTSSIKIDIYGLYFEEGSTSIWHGLKIHRSEKLQNLQEKILSLKQFENIKNEIGSAYFPHFTLGSTPKEDFNIKEYHMNSDLIKLNDVSCKLCIGRCGPNGQLQEVLYE